jgi:hypothetical protein
VRYRLQQCRERALHLPASLFGRRIAPLIRGSHVDLLSAQASRLARLTCWPF